MNIYSINQTNFMAKPVKKINKSTRKSIGDTKYTKANFYKEMEDFYNNRCTKEEYIKNFSAGVTKIIKQKSNAEYNPVEKHYINNLMAVIDSSERSDIIPEEYLKKNISDFLKYKK